MIWIVAFIAAVILWAAAPIFGLSMCRAASKEPPRQGGDND